MSFFSQTIDDRIEDEGGRRVNISAMAVSKMSGIETQVHEGYTAKKYQENCEMACIGTKSLLLTFSRRNFQDHGDNSYTGQGND